MRLHQLSYIVDHYEYMYLSRKNGFPLLWKGKDYTFSSKTLTPWKLVAVLHQPYKQFGKVTVAEPWVPLQTQHSQRRQGFQDVYIQFFETISLQLQLSQRSQPCESISTYHVEVGVVPQSQFDQTPGLPKCPRGDFCQVVAPQVQED